MAGFIKDRISLTLWSAPTVFACAAIDLSREKDWSSVVNLSADQEACVRRVQEQVISSIILSVAAVEAMINEILAESIDPYFPSQDYANVDCSARLRWAKLWKRGAFDRGQNALEKCQLALEVADLEPLNAGVNPVQGFNALIKLRNELIHSEPKYRLHGPDILQKERDHLEKLLEGRFAASLLAHNSAPFIWERCLGEGCAKWAVEIAHAFKNTFFEAIGINGWSEINWDRIQDVRSRRS